MAGENDPYIRDIPDLNVLNATASSHTLRSSLADTKSPKCGSLI